MEENPEIKAANLRVELNYLLQAIPERAAELSVILKNIEKAKSNYAQTLDEIKEAKQKAHESAEEIAAERNLLHTQKTALELDQVEWKQKLGLIKEEVKVANKELRWVNDKVFKSEADVKELDAKAANLQKQIDEMMLLVARIEELKAQVTILEDEKQKIMSDAIGVGEASDKKLADAHRDFLALEEQTRTKTAEAESAQYRVKAYTDELYTHMNDYMIVKARIETYWKRTFPELELPL